MVRRHRLKAKEVKKVLERATVTVGNVDYEPFMKGMEIAKFGLQNEIFYLDGNPVFINIDGETFPTLMNREILNKLPTLTVDMGAVPHLCNGADVMAPGIVKITGQFRAEAVVVVLDEKFSKPIALAKTLYNSEDLSGKKRGKVATNVHFVGDRFWRNFKRGNKRI